MRIRPALLACLLVAAPALARANVFVIPLPGAAGLYAPAPAPAVGERTVSWGFLAGGAGQVTIDGGPAAFVLTCGPSYPPPTVTITGAWLVVDADIPVAARGASWGQVKSTYR